MNILYRDYLKIGGLKIGYEEPKNRVFTMRLMQLHPHYCESPAWGPACGADFAKTIKCLWSASRLDAPQVFMPSQTSFFLHITSLLGAKWLNALLLFDRLNEEEKGNTWDWHKCNFKLLFIRGDIPQLQWDHDFPVIGNIVWGVCRHHCRKTGNCIESVSFEYRL